MTYPKELREATTLADRDYPIQFFHNVSRGATVGQSILFLHWHEHFEIIVMRQGTGVFHIDSQPYEVGPGDVLFVPAGALHTGFSTCDGDTAYLAIVFNAALFHSWSHDSVHAQYVLPYLEGRAKLPVMPAALAPSCAEHYRLLELAAEEFRGKLPGYQLVVVSLMHMLLAYMARTFLPLRRQEGARRGPVPNAEAFKSLIRYVETNVGERHTVEGAAKRLNLNPYHFCKTFKKLTGRTFIDYVNACRVEEAERLLREEDLSVTEIAGLVGCDNPNYFTRLFKRAKGVTPSQYRK